MDELDTGVPIAIHLDTFITQEGEQSHFAFDEDGQLFQMGDSVYLRYQETDEHTKNEIPVTMKIDEDGDVLLTRAGENKLRLRFSDGKRIQARYRTPYGILPVDTVTPFLEIRMRDRPISGTVKVDYQLFAGESLLGDYKIRLQFTA
ncbi:DUF1934 domain-containing protein [Pediococcus inopinatus]|uniref:DUF1934 domain-containing protein n=1 Tax=Pediococcus inopinatus TaxID=114090 RepID=UPI00070D90C7|nr:DUF1934 domain-containing protein [Pediococcus inopinatus]AVL00546.1 hypothetical protein PI20285_07830 [Pediococcus inopinatus]KRN62495.1 hypothetical protein IV83_GL000217 [Pediococcus inopinatus]